VTTPTRPRCNPNDHCYCHLDTHTAWPMHWRPDAAPEAPWPWLDARRDTPEITDQADPD